MGRPTSTSSDTGKRGYRGHWRPAEDEKLRKLVEYYGAQNWNFIAERLEGRSGKSCRLRWYNQLDPNINKSPFTEEEERRLLADHRIYGNKWALIARRFEGRTDNAVKNHYHVVMARRKRERFKLQDHPSDSKLGSLQFQNYDNMVLFSSNSLDSLSFSQPANTMASLSFGVFGGGKDYMGSRTCSSASKGLHGTPNVRKVARHSLRFLNFAEDYESEDITKLVRLDGNMVAFWNSKNMASQIEQGNRSPDPKAVPFIDFLGVGSS